MSLKRKMAAQNKTDDALSVITAGEGGPPPEVQDKIDEKKGDNEEKDDDTDESDSDDSVTAMDDYDLDGFDFSDLSPVGDGMDFDADDVYGGELSITQNPSSGDVDIHHEGGMSSAAMPDEDEFFEVDDTTDDGDDMDGFDEDAAEAMRMYNAQATAAFSMPTDQNAMTDLQWLEGCVAAGLVEAHIHGTDIGTKDKAVKALTSGKYTVGASFVKAMNRDQWSHLNGLMQPVYAEATRVREYLRDSERQAREVAASVSGAERKNFYKEMTQAKIDDIKEANLDCPSSPRIMAMVKTFRKASSPARNTKNKRRSDRTAAPKLDRKASRNGEPNSKNGSPKSVVSAAYLAIANSCAQLTNQGKTRIAAKSFLGDASGDAIRSMEILSHLVNNGDHVTAVNMVSDLIKAVTNPHVRPTTADPTVPVPGSGNRGPMPDAGTSFGEIEETEVRKAMLMLGVGDDKESMRWISSLPTKGGKKLDQTGVVACYNDSPGAGAVTKMSFDDAKNYLASRTARRAVVLANPKDILEVKPDDVSMVLTAATSEDPFYCVVVAGMPIGEIHLADQADPVETREVFTTNTYGKGVRDAIVRYGLEKTMASLRYRPYINTYKRSDEIEAIRAEAAKLAAEEVNAQVNARVDEMLDLMTLAHEGIRRNIYSVADPLKFALHERLRQAGIREASIPQIVEEAINMPLGLPDTPENERKAAMTLYLGVIAAKAVEFMNMQPETLAAVSEQIMGAPVRMRVSSASGVSEESLRERLVRGSQYHTAVPSSSTASAGADGNAEANMRAALNIGLRR